jgi:hypothetical protein
MVDPDKRSGSRHNAQEPLRGTSGGTPRWVVAVGLVLAVALVALIMLLHVSGVMGPGIH